MEIPFVRGMKDDLLFSLESRFYTTEQVEETGEQVRYDIEMDPR